MLNARLKTKILKQKQKNKKNNLSESITGRQLKKRTEKKYVVIMRESKSFYAFVLRPSGKTATNEANYTLSIDMNVNVNVCSC